MSLFRPTPKAAPVEDRQMVLPFGWTTTSYASKADPASGEVSQQSVAVRSTADLIASLVSELPIVATRNDREISTPGNVLDPGSDATGSEDWLYRVLMSWLLKGNMFGYEAAWDSRGRVTAIDPLHPDDVSLAMVDDKPVWTVGGKRVTNAGHFVHARVNPIAGRILGLSPVASHAATIGVSLASTAFGRQWFLDGATPGGQLLNSLADLDDKQTETVKARFMAKFQGTREPIVMGKGWEFKPIQINPEESQFLQTQGFSEAQCARMFGPGMAELMGYETGGSMTYATVVDRRQDALVLSMNKWIRRAERLLTSLTPRPVEISLNRKGLLESTTYQRYQAHALALGNQPWMDVDEVRAIEKLEPMKTKEVPNGEPAQH